MVQERRRKVVRLQNEELMQAIEANHAPTLDPEQTRAWARELSRLRRGFDTGTLAAFVGRTTLTINSAFEGTCQDIQVYQDLRSALSMHAEEPMDSIERAWFDGERAKVGEWLRALALEQFDTVTAAKRAIGTHYERSPQWVHTVFKGLPRSLESYAMVASAMVEELPSWLAVAAPEGSALLPPPPVKEEAELVSSEELEAYGARLRDEVKRVGWTWSQTGAQLGRSRSYIGKLFLGRIEEREPYDQLARALENSDTSGGDETLTQDESDAYAARLKDRVSELDWTQRGAAEHLGIPFNTFKKMLRGARNKRAPYEKALASLANAAPSVRNNAESGISAFYTPPKSTPVLDKLRANAQHAWPHGDLSHVGTWLRASLEAGLHANATRHRASKALATQAGHSIFWVTSRLSGKVRSPDGYDTLAALLGLSLTGAPEAPTPTRMDPPTVTRSSSMDATSVSEITRRLDATLDHNETLMHMIRDLSQTVSALHTRVENLEERPAWADALLEQRPESPETPAATPAALEDAYDELALEAAASHPQGTLLYRTDGEVFLITHAGKAYVATETFGLPLDEDLPKWNPMKKKR